MKAIILAGGVGTRLRPLTYIMPKPLLPVGGRPLLEHTIRYLRDYNIDEIVICVAYLKNRIIEYLKNGHDLGVKITYAEADIPLGTGGQLKTAEKFINDDNFLVMNGDIITTLNIYHLVEFHNQKQGIGTIALKNFQVQVPYGHITLDSNQRILNFDEKPTLTIPSNAGIYIFNKKVLEYIANDRVVSLETEVFPALLESGEQLNGYYEDSYWADVGTITDFEKVDKELLKHYLGT
jgi:mannose-1-phosphate guanylyltransferase